MRETNIISTKQERVAFFQDLAQILASGYTLLVSDIDEIMPYYGWSPNPTARQAASIMANYKVRTALSSEGVDLVVDRFLGNNMIFRDGNLPLEETDIDLTRRRVAAARSEERERAKETKRQQQLASLSRRAISSKSVY